jgi:Uncharacterised protein family (UPF0160)
MRRGLLLGYLGTTNALSLLTAHRSGSRWMQAQIGSQSCQPHKRARFEMSSTAGVSISVPEQWQVVSKHVENQRCIGTHSGSFHCDEALACAMLKSLPEWQDAVIVRSRDPEQLAKCDIVVDVGGVYDPATLRFDHHQKSFVDTFSELGFSTRLSSAGLVYRHFGKEFVKAVVAGRAPDDVVDSVMYEKVSTYHSHQCR